MCIHLTTQNMLCCKTWPLSLQGMLQVSVNTLIGGEMFVQHTTGGWSMSLATKPGQTSFKQEYYSIYLTHKEKIGRQSLDYWVSLAKYLSAVNTQNVVKWHCLEKCGLIPFVILTSAFVLVLRAGSYLLQDVVCWRVFTAQQLVSLECAENHQCHTLLNLLCIQILFTQKCRVTAETSLPVGRVLYKLQE